MDYSTNKIKTAGKTLIKINNDEASLDVLSFWRSLHAEPLDMATELVESTGIKINKNVLVASRLKRTESVVNKLCRLKNKVQLSTMNDIAGCRAILPNLKEVNKLVGKLSKDKTFKKFRDYINTPRDSGYRSIHMIGKFLNSEYDKYMNVELQIRTVVQHSWATAVEIVDLFTKDSIKTNQGSKEWSDFFTQLSKLFFILDKSFDLASQNKKIDVNNKDEYFQEAYKIFFSECSKARVFDDVIKMSDLISELDIVNKFQLFAKSVKLTIEDNKDLMFEDGYILLVIDKNSDNNFKVESKTYHKDLVEEATKDYLIAEKKVIDNEHYVTALVSSNSMGEIEKAYPNYFADSTSFSEYIFLIMALKKEYNKISSPLAKNNFKIIQEIKSLAIGNKIL